MNIREQRLKNIRATKDDLPLRPNGRVSIKKQPRQAAPVTGQVPQKQLANPIRPETIERLYEGKTAVLFATGPGLTQAVVDEVLAAEQELILFGCNDAYRLLPRLDVHYACDHAWWRIHYEEMKDYPLSNGMWTQEPNMDKNRFPKLRRIAGNGAAGLSRKQNLIHFGNNSGYQLINLAYLFGIKNFILCGYNMQVVNNQRHFFGDHPEGLNRSGGYTGFIKPYESIKPAEYGIEIINATPNTALKCFPKTSLTDALRRFQ